MITLMLGKEANGYYSAAVSCAALSQFVFAAIVDMKSVRYSYKYKYGGKYGYKYGSKYGYKYSNADPYERR